MAGKSHSTTHISRDQGSQTTLGGLGLAGRMEYPALGTVEAADSGGTRSYNCSEERKEREPDGLRFDRERASRLWEAVSGAQPVGREEGESGGPQKAVNRGFAGSDRSAGQERRPAPGPTVTPPWRPSRPLASSSQGLTSSRTLLRPRKREPAIQKIKAPALQESGSRAQKM